MARKPFSTISKLEELYIFREAWCEESLKVPVIGYTIFARLSYFYSPPAAYTASQIMASRIGSCSYSEGDKWLNATSVLTGTASEVSNTCFRLISAAKEAESASYTLDSFNISMKSRLERAFLEVEHGFAEIYELINCMVAQMRCDLVSAAHAAVVHQLIIINKVIEDVEDTARFLGSLHDMCCWAVERGATTASIVGLDSLTHFTDVGTLVFPVLDVQSLSLRAHEVWQAGPAAAACTVAGPGVQCYTPNSPSVDARHHNAITLIARTSDAVLAEYVTPDDITLTLRDAAGADMLHSVVVTADQLQPCTFNITYATLQSIHLGSYHLKVFVCGHAVLTRDSLPPAFSFQSFNTCPASGSPAAPATCIDQQPEVVHSYRIATGAKGGKKSGICVSVDGTVLAVSYPIESILCVYTLQPRFESIRCLGSRLRNDVTPCPLKDPHGICFNCRNNVLVCDQAPGMVFEISLEGVVVHVVPVEAALHVAVLDDLVAVSTGYANQILVIHWPTGNRLHTFEALGPTAICFSLDGNYLYAACQEEFDRVVCCFSFDGTIVSQSRQSSSGPLLQQRYYSFDKSIALTSIGEVIALCSGWYTLEAFVVASADNVVTGVRPSWLTREVRDRWHRCNYHPIAIAGPYMYVLNGSRVEVFGHQHHLAKLGVKM